MRIVEPPLASICQDMIDCIGNKEAEPEIVTFFYRMQQRYLKGWRECGFCKGTGKVTTVYPNKWGAKETVEHTCLTCKGLGFFDMDALVKEYEERRKKLLEQED